MTDILWLPDDFQHAIDLLRIRRMPVLVFPMFWEKGKRKELDAFLDRWDTQAYFFEPVEADIKGESIESIYRTDCFEVKTKDPITMDALAKIDRIKGVQPSYLWDRTFLTKDYDLKVTGDKTEFIYARNS